VQKTTKELRVPRSGAYTHTSTISQEKGRTSEIMVKNKANRAFRKGSSVVITKREKRKDSSKG